jgi:hypothetical protein
MTLRNFQSTAFGNGLRHNLSKSGLGQTRVRHTTANLPGGSISRSIDYNFGRSKSKTPWLALLGGFAVIMSCIILGFVYMIGGIGNKKNPTPVALNQPETAGLLVTRTAVPAPTRRATLTPEPDTPTPGKIPMLVPVISGHPVCSCSADRYSCSHFTSQAAAQACYRYCISMGKGDIHKLDHDHDGLACELH